MLSGMCCSAAELCHYSVGMLRLPGSCKEPVFDPNGRGSRLDGYLPSLDVGLVSHPFLFQPIDHLLGTMLGRCHIS